MVDLPRYFVEIQHHLNKMHKPSAEFRLNYVQLIGIGQQLSFGQALIWQAWTLAGIAAASGTFPAIPAHNGPFFVLKYLTKSHNA